MAKIAGIDLGTTFSAIAHLNDMGRPEVIPNSDGERIMPSAAYFSSAGNILVGTEAVNSRRDNVSRSVRWIKSHMGDDQHRTLIDGKEYTPAELSALILKKLHQDAAPQVGEVTDVVISIPANFGEVARKATMDAGTLAGINVIGIVNEPTAAAFYYAITHEISGRVMIFDLGGGTFDISIADVSGKDINIISSGGDRRLGGYVFDDKLVEFFKNKYQEETGSNLFNTPEERADIEDYAEEIKKSLSKKDSTSFRLKGDSGTVRGDITRTEFESMISSDIARIEMLIEATLDEANNEPSDISKVLLVGGSSRIPAVQKLLVRMFNYEPTLIGNVDECVCLGAALYAGLRLLEENPSNVPEGIASGLNDVKVAEICNHSYGTTCLGEDTVMEKLMLKNDILIKKNSRIPCTVSKTFYTIQDGQKIVEGNVTQGESTDLEYVTQIAKGILELPPDLPENSPIEISYSYDKDQRMKCVFEHKESGRRLELTLDLESGTSSAETLEAKRARIEDFTIE